MLDSQTNQSQSQWSWIFGAVKRFTEPCYSSLTDAWPVRYVFYNFVTNCGVERASNALIPE